MRLKIIQYNWKLIYETVILAGGYGTRISEHTNRIPKAYDRNWWKTNIMAYNENYSNFGYKDFYIALGYKSKL